MLHFGSNVRRRHDPVSSRPDELNISFSCLSARWRAFTWLRVQCQGTPQQAYQSFLVCTTTYCSHCGTPVFGAVFPVGPAGERTGVCSQFTVRQPKCLLRTSSDVTWVIYNLLKFKPQAVYKDLTLYMHSVVQTRCLCVYFGFALLTRGKIFNISLLIFVVNSFWYNVLLKCLQIDYFK